MLTSHSNKNGNLKRTAGPIGLMFASTTTMIGSGWLFGAFHVAKLAGPWSILSWVIGAAIMMLIALCFAELATMFPRSGALVHMSHASHGPGLGRLWGWLLFLAYVPIPTVEAEAIVTYANSYLPIFLQPQSDGLLTNVGLVSAMVLLGIFALLNLMSIRWLLNLNTTITWLKILVPLITASALLTSVLHVENLSAAPDSYALTGIFTALPTAGVVFSFFGFRTAIDLAGESTNPNRYIPFSVIGSIVLATVIYITLQVAFLLAIAPEAIANGWNQLNFVNSGGPFAMLAMSLGLTWLAGIIYTDAYISPAGTGLLMTTGGTRVLMANGELRVGPAWLTHINRFGVPWVAVIVMWIFGCIFLLPFPAWQQIVSYISAITVLTYGLGPVALICLRRNAPAAERPFRLRGAIVIAPAAFIAANWVIYWTGYETNQFLYSLLTGGFIVYALYYHFIAKQPAHEFGWFHIAWLLPWFGGMWILSGLGTLGGIGVLSFGWALVTIAVWSLIVMLIAVATSLTPSITKQVINNILAPSAYNEDSAAAGSFAEPASTNRAES
ncbi:APC family permease [Salinisphaera sp. USBA-960]|nr:APC family permease [Salifodinibacter halophilus]NNC25796.1 APC family permease [Salifodinibacter halophilus]